jgi:outer membrane protein OmpA-like peptidoglycan-associated protein
MSSVEGTENTVFKSVSTILGGVDQPVQILWHPSVNIRDRNTTMSALLDFANWVKAAGPSAAAGARPGSPPATGDAPAKPAKESRALAPAPNPELETEVKNRLGALVGPYKKAMSKNGPAAATAKLHMDEVRKHVAQRDFEQAAKDLDGLEPLVEQAAIQAPIGSRSGSATRSAAPVGAEFLVTGDDAGGTGGPVGSGGKGSGSGGTEGGTGADGGSGGAVQADTASGRTGALPATSTDMFFVEGKSDLTASDKKELDKYVEAYKAADSADRIQVYGYASIEGVKKDNEDLAEARAKAVADYLSARGVSSKGEGKGPTNKFDEKDYPPNRRATITPPPSSLRPRIPKSVREKIKGPYLKKLSADERAACLKWLKDHKFSALLVPGKPGTRDEDYQPGYGSQGALAPQPGNVTPTTIDQVVEALKPLTLAGFKPQTPEGQEASKTLDPTDELRELVQAEYARLVALQKALAGNPMKPTGTPLPDPPKKKPDPTYTEMVQKKWKEWKNDIASKLPKKARDYAKKAMDMVLEKGLPYVLDQGIKELGVPSDIEEQVKNAAEEFAKKVTDDKSNEKK